MAKEVEKGKHISVLVEQAFPTCILVSYKDDGKTFRGVLLHESSHTVTRASISQAVDNNESTSSLCLTAARAVTCESNEPPAPSSRVSTRSSTMSQDQINSITPVHKIRGLVKQLHPQKRKAMTFEGNCQSQIGNSQKNTLMSSIKRKRANSDSTNALKLRKEKTEEQPSTKLTLTGNKLSPLFPVLKLRRTAGSSNSYVAVSLDSENTSGLDEQSDATSHDQNSVTTQKSTTHRHNTRSKGQKQTSHNSDGINTKKKQDVQKQDSVSQCNHDESLVEVYTERTTPTSQSQFEEKPKVKQLNTQASKAYAKRGVTPRTHNQQMRVGDIVWGKVHGHPWWPGRILGILCNASESEAGFVKVAWYGSTTTSEISCSFLMTFQENFKQLFKKQKTGAYRRAVREAQHDLQVMAVDGQVMPI